jgi:hypothetical protein
MDKKKSIINIQDLGLSAASQHSIGGQTILRVIYLKLSIFIEEIFYYRKKLFLESFSECRQAADTLSKSPKSFKKSRNKHFVHN